MTHSQTQWLTHLLTHWITTSWLTAHKLSNFLIFLNCSIINALTDSRFTSWLSRFPEVDKLSPPILMLSEVGFKYEGTNRTIFRHSFRKEHFIDILISCLFNDDQLSERSVLHVKCLLIIYLVFFCISLFCTKGKKNLRLPHPRRNIRSDLIILKWRMPW